MNNNGMTKPCKHCKNQIPVKASKCMYCGKSQGMPGWGVALVIIVLVFAFLSSFFENFDEFSDGLSDFSNEDETYEIVKSKFDEQIIYEGHGVVMKLIGSKTTSNGTELNIYIENNSNLNLGFNAHSYGVNGIMTRNNIYDMDTDVAAGKKANATLTIENSTLRELGVNCIKYIDILFWAYDNDKIFKLFATNVIKIKSDKYDEKNSWISGKEIYNSKGIRVDYLAIDDEEIKYVVTNTSGKNIDITFEGISINDYTISDTDYDLFDEQILNNNQMIFEIEVDEEFLKKNNINKINKVDFYLKYTQNDDYKICKTKNMTTIINNN